MSTVVDVFREDVPKAFAFLEDRYGFVLRRLGDDCFAAASDRAEVAIELDWGSVVVSMRPPRRSRSVRLAFIVGAKNPSVLFLPRYPWGPEEAREEIARQAALLASYGAEFLAGRFEEWPAVEAHQDLVVEQWRRESERLVKEARVKLVRKRAEAAWARRSFSEAAQLYGSIRAELNQAEIRRQEYCRRRTILVPVPRPKDAPFEEIA